MKESFLHYLWSYQLYNSEKLRTTEHEVLNIFSQGTQNTDSGPDFNMAKVEISNLLWSGSVEIHVHASDWYLHKHDQDKAYDGVILHVVWNYNRDVYRTDGTKIPCLELKDRVNRGIIDKYALLVPSSLELPCSKILPENKQLIFTKTLENAFLARMKQKQVYVLSVYEHVNNWEEVAYRMLFRAFGTNKNADVFELLAKNLPFLLLRKYSYNILYVESLLFGIAGMLDEDLPHNSYFQLLKKNFVFLSHKHALTASKMKKEQWKFFRMHPKNFPTLRIAQLAQTLHKNSFLFSSFLKFNDLKELYDSLTIQPSHYWQYHHTFNDEHKLANRYGNRLGKAMMDSIVINTVIPLLVAYASHTRNSMFLLKAKKLLSEMPPEKNSIVNKFKEMEWKLIDASDSQALVWQYQNLCLKKKCLDCSLGQKILFS